MKPPVPGITAHQRSLSSVEPFGPCICNRSDVPAVFFKATLKPFCVGVTAIATFSAGPWFKFKPTMATFAVLAFTVLVAHKGNASDERKILWRDHAHATYGGPRITLPGS